MPRQNPRQITFVKHAKPERIDGVNSHDWPLSAEGRAGAARLADGLRDRSFTAVISSDEPKAAETAAVLATALGLPTAVHAGLREHDRTNVPALPTPQFVSAIAHFFRRPDELVLGRETAHAALNRFNVAVDEILTARPAGDLILVTHGTVLSLWLEAHCGLNGYDTWRAMGLPSCVTVSWPAGDVVERRDRV